MSFTVDGTVPTSVSVDGADVSTISVDGTRVWPLLGGTMTAGSDSFSGGGIERGYSQEPGGLGDYGSLTEDTDVNSNFWIYLVWINGSIGGGTGDPNRVIVKVGANVTQSYFQTLRIDTEQGVQEFDSSSADVFTQGGETQWEFFYSNQAFNDGNTYDYKFVV